MALVVFLVLLFLTLAAAVKVPPGLTKCGQSPSYERFTQVYSEEQPGGGFHRRVVSGDEATERDWPWAAAVTVTEMLPNGTLAPEMISCTAAVIHKDWILTAAHCGMEGFYNKIISIGVGSTDVRKQRVFDISELYIHPKFQLHVRINNDIALLKLNESLEFDEHIQPICLSRSIKVQENEILAAAGWGGTFDYMSEVVSAGSLLSAQNRGPVRARHPHDLQERPVAVRNSTYCNVLQEPNDTEYICVGGLNNGLMGGDSGGALMARRNGSWYHVGNAHTAIVVAAESRIDIQDQTHYTETSQFCDFIEKMTSGDVVCEK